MRGVNRQRLPSDPPLRTVLGVAVLCAGVVAAVWGVVGVVGKLIGN